MIIDLDSLASRPAHVERATVCIAGGGIAGLILATNLADSGVHVHLLEAGGETIEHRSQKLYDAEMADARHTGTTDGRFRVFGGSSTRWGGGILPFTDDIFSPEPALGANAWPIPLSCLKPFQSEIEDLLGTNHLPFSAELYSALRTQERPEWLSDPNLRVRFAKTGPFSRRNLARTLGQKALTSNRLTIFLHANVTECALNPQGSRTEAFLVKNYRGDRFRFEADHHILATGTIETTRILLASRSVCPMGVGNSKDQVGRSVHDHVSAPVAEVTGDARRQFIGWLGPFIAGTTTHIGRLEASSQLRRRLGLLAVMAHLTIEEPEESGSFIVRELLRSIQGGNFWSAIRQRLQDLPSASAEALRLAYDAKIRHRRVPSAKAAMPLRVLCEQRPSTCKRIRLSETKRDDLDMPKAVVDWRASSEEFATIQRFAEYLRDEFLRIGVQGIQWRPDLAHASERGLHDVRDTNHLMGGTIMGTDPGRSVVDTDLRVHGIANLYLASMSTFPAGGSSNPTYTLMALTMRLAERLQAIAGSTQAARASA